MKREPLKWTNDMIAHHTRRLSQGGFMPSCKELRRLGRNDLACAIARTGGLKAWAVRLGLQLQECDTTRGNRMESRVAQKLREQGHEVRLTTCKCPFDLLVDKAVRVEVKMARKYLPPNSHGGGCYTFNFGSHSDTRVFDVAVLVCVDQDDAPTAFYLLPKDRCRETVTITAAPTWEQYREKWDLIPPLLTSQ